MDTATLNQLGTKYNCYISNFFNENAKYNNFSDTIRWCFYYHDDISISATADRKTNIIKINYKWFIDCYNNKRDYEIEYFLIHETRHIFQHIVIFDYKKNIDTGVSEEIIKQWIKEGENYIKVIDEDGNVNPNYFKQDVELDAFSYSFALMSYKYGGKYDELLYVDDIYRTELKDIFNDMVEGFKRYFSTI